MYRSRILSFSFNFADKLAESINTSNVKYFKFLSKNNRNIKKIKTLNTIKFLYKLQSDINSENNSYVSLGRNLINVESIPKPRLIYSIRIYKNKHNDNHVKGLDSSDSKSQLTKSIFGIKTNNIDIKRSKIIKDIKEIFPIELRHILFNFTMKYIDYMDEYKLSMLEELIKLESMDDINSILLDYICARLRPPEDLLNKNTILRDLMKFVASSHPWLENKIINE